MSFSNSSNIIDSRDIIARIDELKEELEGLENEVVAAKIATDADEEEADNEDIQAAEDLEEKREELEILLALQEEGEDATSEWSHGATLIRDSYFEEHCQDELDDLDMIPKDLPAFIVIDWKETADNMKADYSTVTYDGEEYYVRST